MLIRVREGVQQGGAVWSECGQGDVLDRFVEGRSPKWSEGGKSKYLGEEVSRQRQQRQGLWRVSGRERKPWI